MKLKVTKISLELFKDFLGKLVKFEQNLFIKIGPDKTYSRIYFDNRDAVKVAELPTGDLFEFDKPLTEEIKVAFYNPKEIITALSFFTSDDIEGEIDYSKDIEGNYANKFTVKNEQEKFNLFCLDKGLSFIDMTDDELANIMQTHELNDDKDSDETYIGSFYMDHDTIKNVGARLRIGKKENKFSFKVKDSDAYVITNNNELKVSDNVTVESEDVDEIWLYKKYLSLLDNENYNVHLCSNKIIFSSVVSDTKLAVAVLPEDERDLDEFMDDDFNEDDLDNLDDLDFGGLE